MKELRFTKEEFEKQILPYYIKNNGQSKLYSFHSNDLSKMFQISIQPLSQNYIDLLQICHDLPSSFSILRPLELVFVNQIPVGFTIKPLNYSDIDSLHLSLPQKIQILDKIRQEISHLIDFGIGYYNICSKKVMFDGKRILLGDIPDSLEFETLGTRISSETTLEYLREQFNMFTISYLNNIPPHQLKERLATTLNQWFLLQEFQPLIGVTDNERCISICYDLLYENKQEQLIIDHLIKGKTMIL